MRESVTRNATRKGVTRKATWIDYIQGDDQTPADVLAELVEDFHATGVVEMCRALIKTRAKNETATVNETQVLAFGRLNYPSQFAELFKRYEAGDAKSWRSFLKGLRKEMETATSGKAPAPDSPIDEEDDDGAGPVE